MMYRMNAIVFDRPTVKSSRFFLFFVFFSFFFSFVQFNISKCAAFNVDRIFHPFVLLWRTFSIWPSILILRLYFSFVVIFSSEFEIFEMKQQVITHQKWFPLLTATVMWLWMSVHVCVCDLCTIFGSVEMERKNRTRGTVAMFNSWLLWILLSDIAYDNNNNTIQ